MEASFLKNLHAIVRLEFPVRSLRLPSFFYVCEVLNSWLAKACMVVAMHGGRANEVFPFILFLGVFEKSSFSFDRPPSSIVLFPSGAPAVSAV